MPVDTTHQEYKNRASQWKRCRDVDIGSDAVKAAGVDYLPKLSGQNFDEYAAYLSRAYLFEVYHRTVKGMAGTIAHKPAHIGYPNIAAIDDFLQNVNGYYLAAGAFAQNVLEEILTVGRCGLYVTLSDEPTNTPTPRIIQIPTEQIINWRMYDDYLEYVVFSESIPDYSTDKYNPEYIDQWRELSIDNGVFTVRIWRRAESPQTDNDFVVVDEIIPQVRGQRLDYIPFCFVNPSNLSPETQKPPLLALAEANLNHYRRSADYEHGLHWCGIPTPVVSGFPADAVLRIGGNTAWVSEEPSARAEMLEFSGQGLNPQRDALRDREMNMAYLGARLLAKETAGVEAAETHRIRNQAEQTVLATMAKTVSQGITKALQTALIFAGLPEQITLDLNTDLSTARMNPQELLALVQAWQGGAITYETMYYNLQQGELTRPKVSVENERDALAIQNTPDGFEV